MLTPRYYSIPACHRCGRVGSGECVPCGRRERIEAAARVRARRAVRRALLRLGINPDTVKVKP